MSIVGIVKDISNIFAIFIKDRHQNSIDDVQLSNQFSLFVKYMLKNFPYTGNSEGNPVKTPCGVCPVTFCWIDDSKYLL